MALEIVLALLAFGQAPPAERWVAFFRFGEGAISAYRHDSVEWDGDQVRALVLWDRSRESQAPFREAFMRFEFSCETRAGRILSFISYRADGSVESSRDQPRELPSMDDSPVSRALADALCAEGDRDFPDPPR